MQQIVDLQQAPAFQSLDVALVSIALDSVETLSAAAKEWNVTTPLLSDTDSTVSAAYHVLQWATPTGEPGHTFVLVDREGIVRWIRDYGAPENGGLMYVPVEELVAEIAGRLPSGP